MVEIFVATTAAARPNPVTGDVQLDFEDKDLREITIQIPLPNLQLLVRTAAAKIESYRQESTSDDQLPLGGQYRTTAFVVSRIPAGVRIEIQLESETGERFVHLDLSPANASLLADDLYEKASPS